ncbi:HAD family hydrolase [Alicyclobacillus sp.]|uniref:HAD family hydrolase n=1 Tax=Alicyclobacillus sp. TaxID=61169 RepID=UPI0025BB750B|nr:HAD family hydrolase [Alicyclobacillus sp.]MCL6517265.1 HAD family hydrolase [Alicyclobacillus sp.]
MAILIFDLDGTLIDTSGLVLPAFRRTLAQFSGTQIPSDDQMRKTFGMPDAEIWRMLMPHASEAERKRAFSLSERFICEAMAHTDVLLPHAREVLEGLRAAGHTLTVASNCGQAYLDAVLTTQDIRRYFVHPLCLGGIGGRTKADILARHVARFGREAMWMVGDRKSDIEAAQQTGIPAIGCQFGFGDPLELRGARAVIHDLRELLSRFS